MEIGNRIATMRAREGLSQRALARASDLSNTTISRIESNDVTPNTNTIGKLAKALGVTLTQLIEDDATPERSTQA